jgi:predicted enzyme related to lactoylglutathione lyase
MGESERGRFVWYELMTTDRDGAIAFYGALTGWKTRPFGPDYLMWVGDQGPLGGVYPLPDEAKAMGAPPHWMSHVTVEDVDASLARARELGAKVYVEPKDIPEVGRFAVIADPQGAAISLFRPAGPMEAHDASKHGEVCWRELLTSDQGAAFGFYSALFGWEKLGEHDLGPMGTYVLFGRGGQQLGGMFATPKEHRTPPAWLYYVNVDDLDAAVAKVKALGGKVMNGPMPIPGGARIAQVADPQGAAFALHEAPPSA